MKLRDEHGEQAALFGWAYFATSMWPELALLHAIPNGSHRHKATAARLKKEGVKRGVPDICLPVPRQGYHGLYIELKVAGGTTSSAQRWWLDRLTAEGYLAVVCRGCDEARWTIHRYLLPQAQRAHATTTTKEACHERDG